MTVLSEQNERAIRRVLDYHARQVIVRDVRPAPGSPLAAPSG